MRNEPQEYDFLQRLGIPPDEKTTNELIEETKELLNWLVEENTDITFLAFSGVGNSEFWNPLREEIMNALSYGMMFVHCLGPIICTDEKGKHVSIEAYKEYPKSVELWLRRIGDPYHWRSFISMRNGKPFFHVYVDFYHEPLVDKNKFYHVSLVDADDPFESQKRWYFDWKMSDHKFRDITTDRVVNVDEDGKLTIMRYQPMEKRTVYKSGIPTLTRYQLDIAYNEARKRGRDLDLLNREEILKLIPSHF